MDSPYGDSFDVLLSNVGLEVLKAYPVVICLSGHEFLPATCEKLSQYLKAGGRLFVTYSQAEQLGPRWDAIRKAGNAERFGLDKERTPQRIETSRWFTPAHWGADAATLAARKKAAELLPYERHFKSEVQRIVSAMAGRYLPVRVSGQIQFLVNRTRHGWTVGLVNNQGVTKENMRPVKVDPSKKQTVSVSIREGQVTQALEWCVAGPLPIQGATVVVDVPPGEIRIVKLTTDSPQSRFGVGGVGHTEAKPPIKVLIVDGFSNHDWARTTALIRGILEPTKRFQNDVATCPAKPSDPGFATFRPRLGDYDVLILNCNSLGSGGQWPAQLREDFVFQAGAPVAPCPLQKVYWERILLRRGREIARWYSGSTLLPKSHGDVTPVAGRPTLLRI